MVITLMIGSFVAILNQTLMISALPTLMHEFDVPSSTVQWLTTGFMLTNGIMIPITAFLIETFTHPPAVPVRDGHICRMILALMHWCPVW
ncbi:MFS transporter [Bifidobacterium longum]|uniref:MFS transporter n=1 Tax=Bifidobacterium longum TaxID=216816 RepID=UPI0026D0FC6B|nr:MFS transporter [Bifidobacterium longum]